MIKKVFFPLLCAVVVLSACMDKQKNNGSPPSSDWKIIFEDNFDRDLSQWNVWYGGAYNDEIQLYRPEQLSLKEGVLHIRTERQVIQGPTTNVDSTQKSFEYVSGRIESKELFGFSELEGDREYRFVARLKLPKGVGMWPAFWTYGDPWPTQGEIDILEARGNRPKQFQSNLFYGPTPGINMNKDTEVEYEADLNLTDHFFVYEMIWKADRIEIWFEGELKHTYLADANNNIDQMALKKQKVVFNNAVGGWFIGNMSSESFGNSAVMEVDWVRVYKR